MIKMYIKRENCTSVSSHHPLNPINNNKKKILVIEMRTLVSSGMDHPVPYEFISTIDN